MKKLLLIIICIAMVATMLFVACSNNTNNEGDSNGGETPIEYTLTISVVGNGSTKGAGKYIEDSVVEMIATADENNVFDGWYLNGKLIYDDATTTTYSITLDGNLNIEARFSPIKTEENVNGVYFEDATLTADGKAKSIYISGSLPTDVTVSYSGNGKSEIGSHVVTATFKNAVTQAIVATKTATLTLVAAQQHIPDTRVYCSSNWANAYCYAWKLTGGAGNQNATWPGQKMTSEGNGLFSYTLNTEYDKIIFNSGSDENKTKDLIKYPNGATTFIGYKYDTVLEKWYAHTAPPTAPEIVADRYAGSFRTESLEVKVNVIGATYSTYRINGGEIYSFDGSKSFNLADTSINESVTIEVSADGIGGNSTKSFTYTKKENRSGILDGLSTKYRTYYQLLVYSFADGNGDGVGDFLGLIEKLDYLVDLGITGIWLSPVNKSTSYHSYDVEDYYAIKPEYEVTVGGTKYDFDRLIAECNERGIVLIMDLVVNHSSSSHPWFIDAASNPNSPYRNWYTFSNGGTQRCVRQYNGSNTWYEGVFAETMPDLNYDNPSVRAEMINVAKYWMEKGVAGFRLDAALMVYTSNYADPFRHFDNTKNLAWWNEFYSGVAAEYPDVYMVGETWDQFIDTYQTTVDYYADGMDSSFSFRTKFEVQNALNGEVNFAQWLATFQSDIRAKQTDAIEAQMLDNHDMVRFTSLVTDLSQLKSAAAMQILSPGNAFIFYGDELAMTGFKGNGYDDQAFRTPMLWGNDKNNCDPSEYMNGNTTAKSETLSGKNVAQQISDANSIYNYYKRLIALKNSIPSLYVGNINAINTGTNYVAAFRSVYGDTNLIIVHNTSNTHGTLRLPSGNYELLGSLCPNGKEAYFTDTTLNLPQYCSAVIKVTGTVSWSSIKGSMGHGSGEMTTNASGGGGGNTTTLHCKKNAGWNDVFIYTWTGTDTPHTGTWPGAKMTAENDNWYTYTVNLSDFNVIFSDGVGSDRTTKSDDLQVSEGGEYWFQNDTWYVAKP